ncbi:MAG: hypothetical protein JEZ03_13150 [Bacteroidales bacterium]|nr:hypothetical protein [Bacteroidales bacterium]
MSFLKNIVIVGSGALGTSLGNVLARKKTYQVVLLSVEKEVVESINADHINHKYFPRILLETSLSATTDEAVLETADIVFMAIPSAFTVDYVLKRTSRINPKAIIVNMAKGFADDKRTVGERLDKVIPQIVCSFKGPTFARELINNQPTAFTVACTQETVFSVFNELFENTTVYLDYSTDLKGVELLSILKNIYAIVVGIVDAQFDSPNLRFMVLTNCFKEMRELLSQFGGNESSMFKYCGFGDFNLTALNDLSRNRTLGLLIGKGFFDEHISEKVVLEGKIATHVFCETISQTKSLSNYHIISELYKVFTDNYDMSKFVNNILKLQDKN